MWDICFMALRCTVKNNGVIVWKKAWDIDNQDWYYRTIFFKTTEHLSAIMDTVKPLVWWQLGDHMPEIMTPCETMSYVGPVD